MEAEFFTAAELRDSGNLVLGAVFVSRRCDLGGGNRFYPGVVVEVAECARLLIGDGNVFYPGTAILAEAGEISIGDANQFGPGGCTIATDAPGQHIAIAAEGRYREGAVILGGMSLGDGSQIIGPIQATGCRLGAGSAYADPDPNKRGGVLKGSGRARSLIVGVGQVILGEGKFDQANLTSQLAFHPVVKS